MKNTLLSALCLLLFAAQAAAQNPYSSICELHVKNWSGSGTLIGTKGNRALVLTAEHVADQVGTKARVDWLWAGGQHSEGVCIAIMPGAGFEGDAALIVCEKPKNVALVEVVAYDQSNGPWIAAGFRGGSMRVATADKSELNGTLVMLNAPLIGGQSGGPCFDRNGRLVAVNVASNFRTVGVCVDGPELRAFINQFRK